MADEPKLQIFKAKGSDGREYHFEAPDFNAATEAARSYAEQNKVDFTMEPPAKSWGPEEIKNWQEGIKGQNEAAIGQNMAGDILGTLGLARLTGQAPIHAAAYLTANKLDDRTKPENEGNRLLRDATRVAPSLLTGGPTAALANFGMGRFLDHFGDQGNTQPPGPGEVASEVAGAVLPGLSTLGGHGGPVLQKLADLAKNNPVTANAVSGGVQAGLASADRTTGTPESTIFGTMLGAGTSLAGKGFKRFLEALPSIEREKVMQKLGELGIDLSSGKQTMDKIQEIIEKMKRPAAAIADAEKKAVDIPGEIDTETARVNLARTLDPMQARNKTNAAFKVVAKTAEEESLNTLRLARARAAANKEVADLEKQVKNTTAVGGAKSAQEAKLARAKEKLFILDEGMRRNQTLAKINQRGPQQQLISAQEYENQLRKSRLKSQFELRDEENKMVAANEVYNKVSREGYDFRNLGPNEKAAIQLLAVKHPGHIVAEMEKDPAAAETASAGFKSLFGPKSAEMQAIKNRLGTDMIDAARDVDNPKFSGGPISGHNMAIFLKKFKPTTIDNIYGDGAYRKLLALSTMLHRSENLRAPATSFRMLLTPYAISTAAGAMMGGSEHGVPYGGIGFVTAMGAHMAWKTIPAMLDDAVNKNTKFGQMLEKMTHVNHPGSTAVKAAPKVVSNSGAPLPTPEQTTSEPPQ